MTDDDERRRRPNVIVRALRRFWAWLTCRQ